jgi:hypothetical protein
MAVSDTVKVVCFEDFKARRDSRQDAAGVPAPHPVTEEPRTLTPHEIAHRFAMLAFLRKAR